jgi:putative acetyltransferase
VIVRPATPADHPAIAAVLDAAFGNDHATLIVEGVRAEGAVLAELVAEVDGEIVGQVLMSRMTVDPARFFAGLGPVGVRPDRQNSSVGDALCRAGIESVRALGAEAVVVLGHPPYYPRFGFSHAAAARIASPFADRPAFMAMELTPGALDAFLKVDYPAAFG